VVSRQLFPFLASTDPSSPSLPHFFIWSSPSFRRWGSPGHRKNGTGLDFLVLMSEFFPLPFSSPLKSTAFALLKGFPCALSSTVWAQTLTLPLLWHMSFAQARLRASYRHFGFPKRGALCVFNISMHPHPPFLPHRLVPPNPRPPPLNVKGTFINQDTLFF